MRERLSGEREPLRTKQRSEQMSMKARGGAGQMRGIFGSSEQLGIELRFQTRGGVFF